MDCQTTSRTLKVKARKAFVPPLLKNAAAQYGSATKLRVASTCTSVSVKRSGYFSRPAPSHLHPTGPVMIPEDHHKKNTDEDSLWRTNTQNSEGIELADYVEASNDVIDCPDVDKVLWKYPLIIAPFMMCVHIEKFLAFDFIELISFGF